MFFRGQRDITSACEALFNKVLVSIKKRLVRRCRIDDCVSRRGVERIVAIVVFEKNGKSDQAIGAVSRAMRNCIVVCLKADRERLFWAEFFLNVIGKIIDKS